MAVYWLGTPGVSQFEYPLGSGQFYNIGDLLPGMTDEEARVLTADGHNFQIPNVYPYGSVLREPAPFTLKRIGVDTTGALLGGPAPQASWAAPQAAPESESTAVVPGVVVSGAAPQGSWQPSVSTLPPEPQPLALGAEPPQVEAEAPAAATKYLKEDWSLAGQTPAEFPTEATPESEAAPTD